MDTNQLIYFRTVVLNKHLTNAAKQLNITQPALTKAIKGLEGEVGAELFTREKRKMILSESGEAFYRRAEIILEQIETAKLEAKELENRSEREIRLAIQAPEYYTGLIEGYIKRFPDGALKNPTDRMLSEEKMLLGGKLDYCIHEYPFSFEELVWTK
ncbi:MAG: LysR family transcriptional regulator, partial [Clostridiales bacterium]|nr:LysR family transcriptional regulator [Clostridiales bacterium]